MDETQKNLYLSLGGNKSAAKRARVGLVIIEKTGKNFRKLSAKKMSLQSRGSKKNDLTSERKE